MCSHALRTACRGNRKLQPGNPAGADRRIADPVAVNRQAVRWSRVRPTVRRSSVRCGVLLVEALVAVAMLAVAIVVGARLLAALAMQRRTMAEYQLATVEAGNVLERLSIVPWDDLTGSLVEKVQLGQVAREQLPEASLEVEITPVGENPQAKRVVVRVRWKARAAQADHVVRLVAWRYKLPPERSGGSQSGKPPGTQ